MLRVAATVLLSSFLAAPAGATTLRVGWPTPPVSQAAPYSRDEGGGIRYAIFDALTRFDGAGQLQPGLAERWTMETPTRWVMHLRRGVVFSNGVPFDAEIAKQSLAILLDPKAPQPKALDVTGIAQVTVRDPFTLEIVTEKPDPLFLRKLTLAPMVEPKAWRELGADKYALTPVGTGPYKIARWGDGNKSLVLEATGTSWRKPALITRVEMRAMPEPAARVAAILSRQMDLVAGFGPDDLDQLKAAGLTVRFLESPDVLSIAFRTVGNDNAAIKDPRVRRALNYAVDKEGIVNNILAGTTRIASQGMTPQVPGYDADVKPYPYDPAKARAMLAEAGYANGFPMRIAVYGGLLAGDQSVFQKVAQDLNSVGVRAELQTMTFSDYVRRLFNGDWKGIDAFSNGWLNVMLGDVGRAMDQYSCAFEAAFFCDESVMPLIAAARTEMDPDKRAELLRTAMAKMNDVGVALWLVEFSFIVAHDPKYTFGRFRRDGSLFEHITQVQK